MTTVGIVGGSGYTGGELLRLLLFHPHVEVIQITSRGQVGRYVHTVHPNLRGVTQLQFVHPDALRACDVLFLALPHGESARHIEHYAPLAPTIIDLSADFRLDSSEVYEHWYGQPHPAPQWLERFVYGLPERNRDALRKAQYASGVGCNATAVNLALWPLIQAGALKRAAIEIKVGSSEGGNQPNAGSHHPVRSGAVRTYKATGHRHQAEVEMMLGRQVSIHFAVTAIEMIRGVHLLAHCFLTEEYSDKAIWKLYRAAYNNEPFVRLVNAKTGLHRLPEPRVVAGTNYCDIGFELDDDGQHLVLVAALDNLGKGAAGSAVQSMNLMLGFDECAGLQFPGIYP
ncbi:MAG: N-acetyl-gamma-glutamyl-phosphate reductase [Chloroflexi bacterium]|nr:MAG: N-acetyl-gamma-glutamyl-phosphate reductase [Phototrophicales bacterium]RMF82270.1 MAG: N-acetyl-gamma-glutamyl-phosphate reductase [Chloroflexota bacterium]